jgi:hypothetical protein
MHNFNVAIVDCSYMFRLLESNHHQDVYQTYKKEIILHIDHRRDLYTSGVLPDDGYFGVAATSSFNPQLLFKVVH